MKTLAAILLVACLIAGAASADNEVTSVNVVGYHRVVAQTNGALTLFSVNLDPMEGGVTNDFLTIFGTNQLVKHDTNPLKADRIYRWNGIGYDIFMQKKSDATFYNISDLATPTNPTIFAGDALWLSPVNSNQVRYITILGQVVAVPTQKTDIVKGLQMIGYPFSSDATINDIGFASSTGSVAHNTNPLKADRIYVWTGSNYKIYGLHTDGKWYDVDDYGGTSPTVTVSMGNGFWYDAKSNVVWEWTTTNKYLENLR